MHRILQAVTDGMCVITCFGESFSTDSAIEAQLAEFCIHYGKCKLKFYMTTKLPPYSNS